MKQNFTNNFLLLAILMVVFSVNALKAQEKSTSSFDTDKKNLIKMNVAALVLNNFSFQIERAVGKKISVALGVRFAPEKGLPLKSQLEDAIDNDDTWQSIKDFNIANFAITPEVRFYLGERVFKGFYIAPFARYSTYDIAGPFKFDTPVSSEIIPLDGDIKALTGGLLFGAQYNLGKSFSLDLFLGGSYGTPSGSMSGRRTLNTQEQQYLRESLEDLEELPLITTTYTVDGDGAKVDFGGKFVTVRGGICLGFRF
ncbi:DUF3575 domain-containing protein [Pedobacter metabolipauper]|uniref:Uncharacterized protein DUF3575 n=1 Tax=Pedobacter metabolipauper TaxID=425513 RepID=A0A4R6T088_9SPHI|nr:DUF3575 domain-containing protein [Pedobacter metabolipauper]TDQ12146.1 uncharacterized protein DUF3575 [Pedobacter metabolipauper]